MLGTPRMKRTAKAMDTLLERIQGVHTPAQRAGCPRDLADDLLSLHGSDPQLVPESNLRFALVGGADRERVSGRLRSASRFTPWRRGPKLYRRIQERGRRPVRRRRPGRRGASRPSAIDVTHPAFSHGMPEDVSDRSDVAQERDEHLCGRGLRTARGGRASTWRRRRPTTWRSASRTPSRSISTATCRRAASIAARDTRPTGSARTDASATRWMDLQLVGQSA